MTQPAPRRAPATGVTLYSALPLLAITLVVALIAYWPLPLPERLAATALFAVAWSVFFALIQLLLGLFVGLLVVLIILGALYSATTAGADPATAIVGAVLALAAIGLFFALLPLVPGALLGYGIYHSLGGGATAVFAGVAAFAVATAVVLVVWFVFRDLVVPFLRGYLLTLISGTLAHQIALTIVAGGDTLRTLLAIEPGATPGAVQAATSLPGLFLRLLLVDFIPSPLGTWIVLAAIVVGMLTAGRHKNG